MGRPFHFLKILLPQPFFPPDPLRLDQEDAASGSQGLLQELDEAVLNLLLQSLSLPSCGLQVRVKSPPRDLICLRLGSALSSSLYHGRIVTDQA